MVALSLRKKICKIGAVMNIFMEVWGGGRHYYRSRKNFMATESIQHYIFESANSASALDTIVFTLCDLNSLY